MKMILTTKNTYTQHSNTIEVTFKNLNLNNNFKLTETQLYSNIIWTIM